MGRTMSNGDRLRRRLQDAGLEDEAIDRAARAGRLPAAAVEHALAGPGRHTLTDLAEAARLPAPYVRELMQAAGRPNPQRGERVFSDDDLEFARLSRTLLDAGLPREELVECGRIVSQAMAQAAEAIRHLAGGALLEPGDTEEEVALRYAHAADELAPLVPKLLDYHFRTHLQDSLRRAWVSEAELEAGALDGTQEVAVAFGDLVDYTRVGGQLPADEMGRLASRLARMAVKAVRPPVQLVKMIGDAAMFVSTEATPLAETMLRLRAAIDEAGDEFPQIRIGAAYGAATSRGGDWFGVTVNLAARIANVAKPGQIVVDEAFSGAAPEHGWTRRRKRALKGIDGRVRLFSLES